MKEKELRARKKEQMSIWMIKIKQKQERK